MSDTTHSKTAEPAAAPAKPRIGMGQMVLIAIVAGIACGVFFGEETRHIKIVGDIYIGLLQMMVLPYIVISLIGGIGKLTLSQAKQMAKYAVLVLLMLWAIIGTFILLLPLALPELQSGSFFSSSLVEPPRSLNIIDIFIPKNWFNSLASNKVPAVVLFCIALGIALITAKEKGDLIKLLDVLSESVMRVIKYIVKLTPIGVFVMTAVATGKMDFAELGRLQGYFILYSVAVPLLAFWVLPGLIFSLTPFKYKDVLTVAWSAVALSFAAAKVLVALPLIIESLKELFRKYEIQNKEAVAVAEVLVPISYPFPNTGKLISLFFVPFVAWFVGQPMGFGDYPAFITSGILSYFGAVTVAMPFLLDVMQLPADYFQLFLLTGVYCGRLSDALGAMDLFAFAALVAAMSSGLLRVQWGRLIFVLASSVLVIGIAIVGVRSYLGSVMEDSPDKAGLVTSMQLMGTPVPHTIIREAAPNPEPVQQGESRLDRINRRGIVRVGVDPDSLPFAFFNASGDLVGFDVDMAHELARDLGVEIEFVIFDKQLLKQAIEADHLDIAMTGVPGTIGLSRTFRFSDPYLFVTPALVVPDHLDVEFTTLSGIRQLDDPRIAIHVDLAELETFQQTVARYLPGAEIVVIDDAQDFFEQKNQGKGTAAFLTDAESGSAWTLINPGYQVVTPFPRSVTIPLVYPFSGGDDSPMDEYMDHWVMLLEHDGTIQRLYDYWILGKGSETKTRRWSVIHDVLGWVD